MLLIFPVVSILLPLLTIFSHIRPGSGLCCSGSLKAYITVIIVKAKKRWSSLTTVKSL